ncbi:hypothetical protein RclHR1_02120016 [Rhizophagus clarus]|uniref:Kinase-like domain-containing protein n=1 Tax=Rhizophagus clarus TaxID=94130 RepID=A0A2Z6R5S3_9GLOM|nr:hypothetical protein RclHR1_02120016 [Rhizophagus clarus]GES90924.1 kinase-like domain-containing protein [Rhizophagus clarus]
MSNNNEFNVAENSDEWINWIEGAITKNYFKHYEYKHFSDIQEIGSGGFGKVYRANWKNSDKYFALKSFFNLNNTTVKEIVNELKLQREVDFHENIIRFCGITTPDQEIHNDNPKKYLLVMEYADSGTLRNYLRKNFDNLTWNDKLKLAFQLTHAVSCLHDEGIVHRDLHSNNVLVHQNTIKLADFGLSRRIEEKSNNQEKSFGVIPYVDPKLFIKHRNDDNQMQSYSLDEKSDVYSIGILLWEISSGEPPFFNESYDQCLAIQILQGLREKPIPDTPEDYVNIYTGCWNGEPDNRPNIKQVVTELKAIITKDSNPIIWVPNKHRGSISTIEVPKNDVYNSFHGELSQIIQEFDLMDTKEIVSSMPSMSSNDQTNKIDDSNYSGIVDKITKDILNMRSNERQEILNCLDEQNITPQEFFNWLLNNQHDSTYVDLLGNFYYSGIGTDVNKQKAVELFQKATNLGNSIAQYDLGNCYLYGIGVDTDYKKAFELFKKSAEGGYSEGIVQLGNCYENEIGTSTNKEKAFELYKEAAYLGSISGTDNLAYCYQFGTGTDISEKKAYELFKKAADLGYDRAQYNLAYMYEIGDGISKDIDKAYYWYKKSAEQGNEEAISKLKRIKHKKKHNSCKIN